MKPGVIAAVVIVAAYAGLEHYAVKKAQPRMEPDFIYQERIEARVAVQACTQVSAEEVSAFDRAMERVLRRLRNDLAESSGLDSAAVEVRIDELAREAEVRTLATLDAEGCDSFIAKRLIRRHEIHAQRAGG